MTYEEFYKDFREATANMGASLIRKGQTAYNILSLREPDVAKNLPEELDPYYDDVNLPGFFKWVAENLPSGEEDESV